MDAQVPAVQPAPAAAAKAADAILELLDNPNRCEEMGLAGRKRAVKMFDVRHVVAKHMQIYEELLMNCS